MAPLCAVLTRVSVSASAGKLPISTFPVSAQTSFGAISSCIEEKKKFLMGLQFGGQDGVGVAMLGRGLLGWLDDRCQRPSWELFGLKYTRISIVSCFRSRVWGGRGDEQTEF